MTGADDLSADERGIPDLVLDLFLKYSVLIDAKESTWHRRMALMILTVLMKSRRVVAAA